MFTVSSPAATTALTTRDAVKAELQINGTDEDDYIDGQIAVASSLICTYLGIAPASNGTRTLGRETLVETVRLDRRSYGLPSRLYAHACGRSTIVLSRLPVVSIASVEEDDETVDPADYEVDGATGILQRLDSDLPRDFWASKTVITYTAGWLLPGDDGRNLPQDIEDACIALIRAARAARTRDPALRGENILSGVYSYSLFDPSNGESALPPAVCYALDKYRNISVG